MHASPFLQFDGNCREAFAFYGMCFGSAPGTTITYGQSPMADQVPEHYRSRIMYAELHIGQTVIMGSDVMAQFRPAAGFHINVRADSTEEAERLFAVLSGGGVIDMPMQETFWAPRFGTLTDRFGKPWMVDCQD